MSHTEIHCIQATDVVTPVQSAKKARMGDASPPPAPVQQIVDVQPDPPMLTATLDSIPRSTCVGLAVDLGPEGVRGAALCWSASTVVYVSSAGAPRNVLLEVMRRCALSVVHAPGLLRWCCDVLGAATTHEKCGM